METYIPQGGEKKNSEPVRPPKKEEKPVFFEPSALNNTLPLWEKLLFFFLGFLGFQILGQLFAVVLLPSQAMLGEETYQTLMNFFSYLILVMIFLLILFFDKNKGIRAVVHGFTKGRNYLWALLALALMFLVNQIFNLIYRAAVPEIYGSNANEATLESSILSNPLDGTLMFFCVVLFAPFCEEITYRVGLVDTIGHSARYRWLGVFLSGIIFGLIHFQGLSWLMVYQAWMSGNTQMLQSLAGTSFDVASAAEAWNAFLNEWLNLPIYISMGWILGLAYAKTGELSTSWTAHLSNNLLSFAAILISASLPQAAPASSASATALLPLSLLSGGLFFLR